MATVLAQKSLEIQTCSAAFLPVIILLLVLIFIEHP
jgi:hypothetical protein